MPASDNSNGYEEVATRFIAGRGRNRSGVGASAVINWSATLSHGASILDLGCGNGVPISQALIERGFKVYGVDASPTMVAAFQAQFPGVPVQCVAVEDSNFFGQDFDAVIAWGLLFLLDADAQIRLISKIAAVLRSGGRFLFTAPSQSCSWHDAMTGLLSVSLGQEAYRNALEGATLSLLGTQVDEGENHYYLAMKK